VVALYIFIWKVSGLNLGWVTVYSNLSCVFTQPLHVVDSLLGDCLEIGQQRCLPSLYMIHYSHLLNIF
jgi:hypothetical protein